MNVHVSTFSLEKMFFSEKNSSCGLSWIFEKEDKRRSGGSTRYWSPGSGFISELFRSLMPTMITLPRRRLHAVVFKAEVH